LIGNTKNKGIFGGENVKDIEKSMSFGISFIFTLFLSSLSGFYFGKHIMGWPDIYVKYNCNNNNNAEFSFGFNRLHLDNDNGNSVIHNKNRQEG
jgi:hypothetical protein